MSQQSIGTDRVVYTTCMCNCGSNHQCVLKAHVKDGRGVAVEPDDRYNTGVGREDEVLSEQELIQTRLQRRPCTKGLAFHKYLYHPDRLLSPTSVLLEESTTRMKRGWKI